MLHLHPARGAGSGRDRMRRCPFERKNVGGSRPVHELCAERSATVLSEHTAVTPGWLTVRTGEHKHALALLWLLEEAAGKE